MWKAAAVSRAPERDAVQVRGRCGGAGGERRGRELQPLAVAEEEDAVALTGRVDGKLEEEGGLAAEATTQGAERARRPCQMSD